MSYLDGRRSGFPYSGEVDQILELFNLPISQKSNALEYKELKTKSNLTTVERERLNNLTISLQHYIIDVEKWNYFGDVIVNMQNHYLNETVGFVNNLQNETKLYADAKKTEFQAIASSKTAEFQAEVDKVSYKGEWKPSTQYYAKNIVTSGGEGFIAQRDNFNQVPSNTTYWGKIAEKGGKGDPSLNINYKGEYNVGTPYAMGDAVTFGGMWYYAKSNTSGNPPTNATYWELQSNQTAIGTVAPFDSRVNLWIDTSK